MKKIPKSRVAGLLSMLFLLVFAACGSLPEEAAQYAAGTQDTAGQTTEERAESTKHAGTLDEVRKRPGIRHWKSIISMWGRVTRH